MHYKLLPVLPSLPPMATRPFDIAALDNGIRHRLYQLTNKPATVNSLC